MERFRMELESLSKNEEFARVVVAVFLSRWIRRWRKLMM